MSELAPQAREQQRLLAYRAALNEGISPEARLWIALVPSWTVELARAAHFPGDAESVASQLLERSMLERVGRTRGPRTLLRMPQQTREGVLAGVFANDTTRELLRQTLVAIAASLQQLGEAAVPQETWRWSALAVEAAAFGECARVLEEHVQVQLGSSGTSGALNWISAAGALAQLLSRLQDPTLQQAIDRSARRLELERRRERDRASLNEFLRRQDHDDVLERLVRGELRAPDDTPVWALHFIGAGGTGKTMLVRHLGVDLAESWNAIVSRVDFDFLNPDYPRRAPGLLLWAFVQDLRLYDASGRASRLLDQVCEIVLKLHERIQHERETDEFATRARRDLMGSALHAFAEALQALSDGTRPILLILDTCEELARFDEAGGESTPIRETFNVLSALRGEGDSEYGIFAPCRNLFAILSGRRLVAQSGANFATKQDALSGRKRPYLWLHEVRGFTKPQAEEFLRLKAGAPDDYVEPILGKTTDTGSVVSVDWAGQGAAPEALRFHPYALRMYADWVRDEPRPTLEEIQNADESRYIEFRILQRLRSPEVEALLPAMAWLGTFDREILGTLSGRTGADLERVFQLAIGFEWVELRTGGSTGQLMYRVEPKLCERIRRYFGAPDRSQLATVAEYLQRRTLGERLDEIDAGLVDATLRALAHDVEPAYAWWTQLTARFRAERHPEFALKVLDELVGEGGFAAAHRDSEDEESAFRPVVLDAWASSAAAANRSERLAEAWREVVNKAARFPLAEAAKLLTVRGLAGVAVFDTSGAESISGLRAAIEASAERLDPDTSLLVLAGLDGLCSRNSLPEMAWDDLAALLRACVARGLGKVRTIEDTAALAALALEGFMRGLIEVHQGRYDAARAAFSDAIGGAQELNRRTTAFPSGYWKTDDVAALVMHRTINLSYPLLLPAGAFAARLRDFRITSATAEAPKLGAAWTTVSLAIGPVERGELPPLPLQAPDAAQCAFSSGHLLAAFDCLRQIDSNATPELMLSVARTGVSLATLARHADLGLTWVSALGASHEPIDRALSWQLEAIVGSISQEAIPDPPAFVRSSERVAWLHAIFRSLVIDSPAKLQLVLSWLLAQQSELSEISMDGRKSQAQAALLLDLRELAKLASVYQLHDLALPSQAQSHFTASAWWRENPLAPLEALALSLRMLALGSGDERPLIAELTQRVGARRAANLALDEAEVLGLRLPHAAAELYGLAAECFAACKDDGGVFLTSTARAMLDKRDGTLARALDAYETLRHKIGAPEFAVLDGELSERSFEAELDRFEGWMPWMLRLSLCHARDLDRARFARVRHDWETGYGTRAPADLKRLLHLDGAPDSMSASSEKGTASGLSALRVTISATSGDSVLTREHYAHRSAHLQAVLDSFANVVDTDVYLAGTEPYRLNRFEAPPALVAAARGKGAVLLDVGPGIHGPAWEAFLDEHVLPGGRTVRSSPNPRFTPATNFQDSKITCLAAHELDFGIAELGWAPAGLELVRSFELSEDARARVVHAIGIVRDTSVGFSFTLGGASERGRSFTAGQLLHRYPRAQLCVLQARPSPEYSKRTSTDRFEAMSLRLFAAELVSGGFPAVLILPSLIPDEGVRAIVAVAAALQELESAAAETLIDVRARIQEAIRDSAGKDPEDAWERAMDVCVYVPT